MVLFDIDQNQLVYSTYLGGEDYEYGNDIVADTSGNVYLTGLTRSADFPAAGAGFDHTHNGWEDIFVARLSLDMTPVEPEDGEAELPKLFALHQNHPNPFNSTTEIRYDLGQPVHVTLSVYNILGAEVATLVDKDLETRSYQTYWDAGDLASGVYFCVLEAGEFRQVKKMVLLK
jgi:hypothetical protein